MPIKAVDENTVAALFDARLVVGIGGPHVGAHLEDLSFSERRMKSISRAQKLDRGTHGDGALLGALDHCRADHEFVVGARHDIERNARVQEAHCAGQRHLARTDAHHFAAHAAQFRKRLASRPSAAIDDDIRLAMRFAIHAKADLAAFRTQALGQRRQRDARVQMAFVGEEQAFAEAPRKIRLKLRDARFVHWRMRFRSRREAVDLACVARRRDNQRALARHARNARVPPVDRALAKLDHALGGAFAFTERSEHATGEPRRVAAELARPLNERDLRAALGECKRGR